MSTEQVVSNTSDLEWASVSAYLQWLEVQAGLSPFSVSCVYSFQVGKGGFLALASKKKKLAGILGDNLQKLEAWVASHELEVETTEMVFIRSLWATTKDALAIVQGHVTRATMLGNSKQFAGIGKTDRGDYDDNPFPF